MDATEFYAGDWLKAADIGEKRVKVQIASIEAAQIKEGKPKKLVLEFSELQKKLVLNKTNAGKLMDAWGRETNGWIGKVVELYTALTTFQGAEVLALRLKPME